jgi:hypothetical protein
MSAFGIPFLVTETQDILFRLSNPEICERTEKLKGEKAIEEDDRHEFICQMAEPANIVYFKGSNADLTGRTLVR